MKQMPNHPHPLSAMADSFALISCRIAINFSIPVNTSSEKALNTSRPILAYSSLRPSILSRSCSFSANTWYRLS